MSSLKLILTLEMSAEYPKNINFLFFRTVSNDNYFPLIYCLGELLSSDWKHFTISGIEYFSVRFFEKQNVQRFLNSSN